ncbi:phospholipase B1, membrane-associated-like [Athalia rosae]|uniref:phospholipase B1, membrane-associated-like n=1 Tax=Athalia rosae TaxID=37344 RepID=UPI002033B434|nr:phospholipase B1, membrane-associated-like [Athalia rosae]XP_048506216.1 phospholipase B1, membrane-associated-like [Athalia rosae]XP_048506217.1 phospholipase B1, membrane-associated-like [Athalia rosae]XP_048506218.1 phospholipase B1, membrane-associated-like [Athalia rosae]XP_048506219.1 phospholipase B1, membrane-associated-like [Athalia rosae]
MRISHSIGLLLLFWTVCCRSQRTALDDNIEILRSIRNLATIIIGRTSSPEGRQLKNARTQRILQPLINSRTQFPCDLTNARSPRPPTSVHKVRPGDIDVIAAMGDSLTAGYGAMATALPHLMIENRGLSWSGGGQGTWREYLTLPNIIKVFNPNVVGYALSDGYTTNKESQFNVAEALAMSRDLPFMAQTLVKRIKNDKRVDMNTHWKLITILIGPNDFCSEMCYQRSPWSILERHRADLLSTFRILRDNLPRTIISLTVAPNLKVLVDFTGRSSLCEMTVDVECSCLFGLRWRYRREEFYKIMREWQKIDEEFGTLAEFQREDFTIVTQPFITNASFPLTPSGLTDFTYLSADCFHLSQKGYARAANALWNNLLEPVGRKSRSWDDTFKRFLCPTEKRPYISTLGNS